MQLLAANPTLSSWSWANIQAIYQVLGLQLRDYQDIAERFELHLPIEVEPGDVIPLTDLDKQDFVSRWYMGVRQINAQLKALDDEIRRRQQLIGVMG